MQREKIVEALDKAIDACIESGCIRADKLAAHLEALGLAVVPREPTEGMLAQEWQDIASAPRDRTHVLVKVRDDAFAGRHFAHYAGRCFVAFHEGATLGGYDMGWALFPGFGGVPDSELEGWQPFPAPPVTAAEGGK